MWIRLTAKGKIAMLCAGSWNHDAQTELALARSHRRTARGIRVASQPDARNEPIEARGFRAYAAVVAGRGQWHARRACGGQRFRVGPNDREAAGGTRQAEARQSERSRGMMTEQQIHELRKRMEGRAQKTAASG